MLVNIFNISGDQKVDLQRAGLGVQHHQARLVLLPAGFVTNSARALGEFLGEFVSPTSPGGIAAARSPNSGFGKDKMQQWQRCRGIVGS